MRQLTLREIQLEELSLLSYFDEFCNRNRLKYSLVYGTLIGAARHKGFIPWDDDIDVAMPRPDYEKLLSLRSSFNSGAIELIADKFNHSLDATYAAVINRDIPCKNTYSMTKRSQYLWIDVFPVDGFTEDYEKMESIYRQSQFLQKIVTLASARMFKGKTVLHALGKLFIVPFCRLYGINRCLKKMDSLAKTYPYESAKYVGIIAWGEGVKEKLLKTDFENMTTIEFEERQFSVMSCWKEYLDNMYTDYTKLTPIEMRVGHNIIAYKKM